MPRWRLTKFSTSSNSSNTGAFAAANTRANASVPGGVVSAALPRAETPASPANCRARSIQGVSRPGAGSQALPTKTPTRAADASGDTYTPLSRSPTPGNASALGPAIREVVQGRERVGLATAELRDQRQDRRGVLRSAGEPA